jgi:ribosomal protein S18 acetylase RimI-like enzyme
MTHPLLIKIIDHKDQAQAEAIHRVLFNAYREEAWLLELAEAEFFPLGRTVAHIQAADACFLGCFLKSILIAVAEIETEGPQKINIGSFVVTPEMFRRGIGSILLGNILTRFAGCTMTVSTAQKNLPAIGLYEKFGFTAQFYWHTPDGIAMVTLGRKTTPR